MTDIEKAIKHFKCVYDGAKAVLDSGFGKEPDQSPLLHERRKLYAKLAIEALEKQIPKKVVLGYDEQDYVRCPQCKREIAPMDDDCLLYHCPGCGEKDAILQGDRYCFNCGQALDWSGAE